MSKLFQFNGSEWVEIAKNGLDGMSITGPMGPRGPKGESITGPKGKDGKDGSPDTAEEIISKIDGKLSYDNLKDLPNLATYRGRGSKTVSLSELDDVNLTGLTQTNGKYDLGSGGGAVTSVNTLTGVVVLDTSDIAATTNKNYVTDAQATVIGNTSGTNTGDQVGDGTTITGAGTVGDPFVAVAGGSGTVTSVSVTTANGVSGSVATATTTPAITLTLGAITPTTVNSVTISGSATPTLAVTGTTAVSGTNTGDQTNISGNAATVTTNANLTGPITSVGNATSIASQTGTGTKFVVDTSPTIATSLTGSYLTASEMLITDASKNIVSAPVATYPSLTELSYAKGVTSAIQTQINAKITNPMTTGGDVIYGGASGLPTRLANGSAGEVLQSNGTTLAPTWVAAGAGDMVLASVQTVTGAKTFGSAGAVGKLKVAGTTSGAVTLDTSAVAGTAVVTIPAVTDTLIGKATTDTLTNKTYDTAGAGNSFSINGTAITAVTGTGAVSLTTSPTFITPVLGVASATSLATSAATPLLLTNGQLVNVALTSQTVAATTLTIPDFASVVDEFTFKTKAQTMSNKTFVAPILGTPTSGTLTNCTGLPAASVVAGSFGTGAYVMDSSLQVSTVELGHATDTTIARAAAGEVTIEGDRVLTDTPKVLAAASYTTDTGTSLNMDNLSQFIITAQAGALLFNAPGGTLVQGQSLVIRIKDNGTARALTWNAVFRAMGTALPSTTVLSKTLYLGFFYNSTDTKWDLVASAQEV